MEVEDFTRAVIAVLNSVHVELGAIRLELASIGHSLLQIREEAARLEAIRQSYYENWYSEHKH